MYCSYAEYAALGGTMTEAQFAVYGDRASRKIDQLTYGRASAYAEKYTDQFADACAQIADVIRAYRLHAADRVGIASASNDGVSETYITSGAGKSLDASCVQILADAIGNDVDGLLYAGVV